MRRSLAVISLLFAWLCANGAIWDLAQVFAWGKMFVGYSTTLPVGAALRETLDPAKACELCVGVATAKAQSSQKLPSVDRDGVKLVLALEGATVTVPVPASPAWPRLAEPARVEWRPAVPVPPPRV